LQTEVREKDNREMNYTCTETHTASYKPGLRFVKWHESSACACVAYTVIFPLEYDTKLAAQWAMGKDNKTLSC